VMCTFRLEGLSRWNEARRLAANKQYSKHLLTFNPELACKISSQIVKEHRIQVNQFSNTYHGIRLLPHHYGPIQPESAHHLLKSPK